MSIYLKISKDGRNENLFIFFQNGNKTTGSAQKTRVLRVSGNTAIFSALDDIQYLDYEDMY